MFVTLGPDSYEILFVVPYVPWCRSTRHQQHMHCMPPMTVTEPSTHCTAATAAVIPEAAAMQSQIAAFEQACVTSSEMLLIAFQL